MPVTVASVSTQDALRRINQHRVFRMAGLDWVFYSDGTNLVYRTSYDNYGSAVAVRACAYGFWFDVCFDGVYLHYAVIDGTTLYYRRGTPNNNGTITWSAVEQSVSLGGLGANYPSICVDTSGHAFVGYYLYVASGQQYPYVVKNANTDGTWSTASGFPYQLTTTASAYWIVTMVALTNNKVYAFYCRYGQTGRGKLYDGTSWGSEETVTVSNMRQGYYICVVADGDVIHYVYGDYAAYRILYRRRNADGTFSSEEVVMFGLGTSYMQGALCFDSSTGKLYCFFYTDTIYPTIKYAVRNTAWGSALILVQDSGGVFSGGEDSIHCFSKVEAQKICVVYMRNAGTAYEIRLETLSLVPPVGVPRFIGDSLSGAVIIV